MGIHSSILAYGQRSLAGYGPKGHSQSVQLLSRV